MNIGILQLSSMALQLFTVPIIYRQYGIEIFGEIALSTSFAYLFGNVINYGTNQTAVKHVAIFKSNQSQLSDLFSKVLQLRMLLLIFTLFSIVILSYMSSLNSLVWVSILPFFVAEVFNPFFFLMGVEKINWLSWGNMIARMISFLLILLVNVKNLQAFYLNIFVGSPLLLLHASLFIIIILKFQIKIIFKSLKTIKSQIINNFYVTFNGSIGILQQSIFLFFVAGSFNTYTLGSYGLVDKILNAIRQIVSAFSSAVYPRASILFHQGNSNWLILRKRLQKIYIICSILIGILLYLFATQIVVFVGNDFNQIAVHYIKLLSFSIFFVSLNANNVLDLLLTEKYKSMFYISVAILASTLLISYLLSSRIFHMSIGWYPILIESICFLIYSFAIKKLKLHAL